MLCEWKTASKETYCCSFAAPMGSCDDCASLCPKNVHIRFTWYGEDACCWCFVPDAINLYTTTTTTTTTTTPPPPPPPPTTTTLAPTPPPPSYFPSTSKVNLENSNSLTMSELKIGHRVQTGIDM